MTVEEYFIAYLADVLGVPVYAERPETPPELWVRVEKTGGGGDRYGISTPTLAVQSYGPTRYRAANLNEQVKAAMLASVARPEVSHCDLNSDYPFDDTTRREYRYQAVFDLVVFI